MGMTEIAQFAKYEATVRTRCDPRFGQVRPEVRALEGERMVFQACWLIEPAEREAYAGEWAMAPPEGVRVAWLASGDLEDIRPAP